MLHTSLLLTLITSVLCSEDITVKIGPHTSFAIVEMQCRKHKSITIGNVPVPKGTTSAPCEMGKSCWQQLTDRQLAVLSPGANAETGIIVVYPVDKRKSPSAIIVRGNKDSSIEPLIPSDVGVIETIRPHYNVLTPILLLYTESVLKTELIGNIRFQDRNADRDANKHDLGVPYLTEGIQGKEVYLLTGRTGSEMMDYKVTCSDGSSALFRVNITAGRNSPYTIDRVPFSGANIREPWKFLLLLLPAIAISANIEKNI